jgi:hypothetical protein
LTWGKGGAVRIVARAIGGVGKFGILAGETENFSFKFWWCHWGMKSRKVESLKVEE